MKQNKLLVTGGAGFIGSNFVGHAIRAGFEVTILDALTYAGRRENLADIPAGWNLVVGDIRDAKAVANILDEFRPQAVINFAAESHVDRSITNPASFVETNVLGVFNMLNVSNQYWQTLDGHEKAGFRFVQVSTDEVFGSLGDTGYFSEQTPYAPNSPYSASKAGGDHLARAWFHTYKLPVIVTNCSNNYGPKQFPEKLIPHMIHCALQEKPLPVYGNGQNVRDWIHVDDHCRGIVRALEIGRPGEAYCFGGRSERTNLQLVNQICTLLDQKRPRSGGKSYADLITFVEDRKGHDWRYAIDDSKAQDELGYQREFQVFEVGLSHTVDWYLKNQNWVHAVLKS